MKKRLSNTNLEDEDKKKKIVIVPGAHTSIRRTRKARRGSTTC
jgi:hypothetical protein